MDPEFSPLDLVQCHLCESMVPPLHCDLCSTYLCKACVAEHLSDKSKEHKLVPFELRRTSIICQKHSLKICELYCKQCDVPICAVCISSKMHQGHTFADVLKSLEIKKQIVLQRDLQELEKYVYPKYQEIAFDIIKQKAALHKNSKNLTEAIYKNGENLHNEIDRCVREKKIELYNINLEIHNVLTKQDDEITRTISEIKQTIEDLKELLKLDNVSYVSTYKSRNVEFRKLPPKINVSLPSFTLQKINKGNINQHMGHLVASQIKSDVHGYQIVASGAESTTNERPLVDEPMIIASIDLFSIDDMPPSPPRISCLSDDEVWTCGHDSILRQFNFQHPLVKSVQTKSGNTPYDIVVTKSKNLVYTDYIDRTVNKVKKRKIKEVIRLKEWRPLNVCSTSTGDLLVVMESDSKLSAQTRIVRYSGSIEKQHIQYNDQGQSLYSNDRSVSIAFCLKRNIKFIRENRNLDVCVADVGAKRVVVVNKAGKFRFNYNGTNSTTGKPFEPYGITTDSQSRILTTDSSNNCIHVIDKDGIFLRSLHINKYHIKVVCSCFHDKHHLFGAAEEGKLLKIEYSK